MDDFGKIFWGFIFSAIGVAFGWTLNQLGQWFRAKGEDKRNIKIVLFNLLETYFIFIRSDIDKIVQKVTNKVFEKIPKDQQTEELKGIMNSIYTGVLTNHLKPELLEELKHVQANYQNSIKTLASIDPLTAYYLSGKTNIIQSFETIQSWVDNLQIEYPADTTEIEMGAKQVLGIIKPNIINDTLKELEKDIRKISWKINPIVWLKSINAINRLKKNTNENFDKEIDKLFAQVTSVMGAK